MALESRIAKLEKELDRELSHDLPDVRMLSIEELEKLSWEITKFLLRGKLKREPTDDEIAADTKS